VTRTDSKRDMGWCWRTCPCKERYSGYNPTATSTSSAAQPRTQKIWSVAPHLLYCSVVSSVSFSPSVHSVTLPRSHAAYQTCAPVFHWSIHSFIHSLILAPLQETTTRRHSQLSCGQRRMTSEKCNIWKGGPSARKAVNKGDHSMLMDPQQKMPAIA